MFEEFFPFKPYEPQTNFMKVMEKTLFDKKVGLLESPTGTGKSLMMLSVALGYINKKKGENQKETQSNSDNWLDNFGGTPKKNSKKNKKTITDDKINLIYNKIIKKDKMLIYDEIDNAIGIEENEFQIFFCTRTHSQISQVISEAKKISKNYNDKYKKTFDFSFGFVGSRKHLCVNKKVNTGGISISLLNARCSELCDKSNKNACEYNNQNSISILTSEIKNQIKDIEDLMSLSKELSGCPYYACRNSLPSSDFILLPYTSLLSKRIRNSLGIKLKNKIVIFDEAHNIIETMLQCNNSEIDASIIKCFGVAITMYYCKYSAKLKASNNLLIRQIMKLIDLIFHYLTTLLSDTSPTSDITTIKLTDFVIDSNINGFNIFKLVKFIDDAELSDKLKWMYEEILSKEIKPEEILSNLKNTFPHFSLENKDIDPRALFKQYISNDIVNKISLFLLGITNVDDDGIVILSKKEKQFKFQMINPKRDFEQIIAEAKCVIFAGGTMQPFDDYYNLFSNVKGVDPARDITAYAGEHVISKDNIRTFIVKNGVVDNSALTFNYDSLKNQGTKMINEILDHIKIFSSFLPLGGIAVFFPSYDLMNKVISENSRTKKIKDDLFYEKTNSNEEVFEEYKENINKKCKGIIFAVIGGKLSEGINFNDNLCRMLMIFGLPFANAKAPEIKFKMQYYDNMKKVHQNSLSGNDYYVNTCIKNVNQTIGRCIRHVNDYALVFLFDSRYETERIKKKISNWAKHNIFTISNEDTFMKAKEEIKAFYNKF